MKKLFLIILISIILCSCTFFLIKPEKDYLNIYFLDVGYGDCTYIKLPNGQNILIDCGEKENVKKVIKFLRNKRVKKFSYIIITHFHPDHSGGLEEIISNFETEMILINQDPSIDLHPTLEIPDILKNKIFKRFKVVKADYRINISPNIKDLKFKVIHPKRIKNDPNYSSLVLYLKYKKIKILFPGDITPEARLELISNYKEEIDVDILKVPHHGKRYCFEFAKATSPKVAIFSLGSHIYNRPNINEFKGYAQVDSSILRTDKLGDIRIKTDGINLWIYTEEEKNEVKD